jgi:hypothetical protein
MRGYDYGGQVLSTDSLGKSISSGYSAAMGAYKDLKDIDKDDKKPDKPDQPKNTSNPTPPSASNNYVRGVVGGVPDLMGGGNARGGKIKQVAGKPIGKDDGLIPAQKGEWVIRKSAVKKLGNKVLSQVNKGKLPTGRGR